MLIALLLALVATSGATIVIDSNGVVHVHIHTYIENGWNVITLPVEPIAPTLRVIIGNSVVVPIYTNMTLLFFSNTSGYGDIEYIAAVKVSNNTLRLYIADNATVKLVIAPNIVLLTVPQNVIDVETLSNGTLVLVLRGPQTISFVVAKTTPTLSPTPIPPATSSPTSTPVYTASRGATTSVSSGGIPSYIPAVLAIAVVICIVLAVLKFFRIRRGSEGSSTLHLDDTDKAILRKLIEKGGSSYQSEIQRELGIPRTTLWRHVKKLEKLGIVEVVKEGNLNRLVLKKKVSL